MERRQVGICGKGALRVSETQAPEGLICAYAATCRLIPVSRAGSAIV